MERIAPLQLSSTVPRPVLSSPPIAYLADTSSPCNNEDRQTYLADPSNDNAPFANIPTNNIPLQLEVSELDTGRTLENTALECQPMFRGCPPDHHHLLSQPLPSQKPLRSLTSMLSRLQETARDVNRSQTQQGTETLPSYRAQSMAKAGGVRYLQGVTSSPIRPSAPFQAGALYDVGRRVDSENEGVGRGRSFAKVHSLPSVLSFLGDSAEGIRAGHGVPASSLFQTTSVRTWTSAGPSDVCGTQPSEQLPSRLARSNTEDRKAAELLDLLRDGTTSVFGNARVVLGSSP